MVFVTDREMISNPLQFKPSCREMTSNPLCASIWWSNEMWEGSEEGGKILAKIFWGNWGREMVFALEFATVISNSSELTWQYRSCGLHRGKKFYNLATTLCVSETKNTNLVFSVFIILTQNFWVWVMKTRLGNQTKQKQLRGSHIFFITELWVSSYVARVRFGMRVRVRVRD